MTFIITAKKQRFVDKMQNAPCVCEHYIARCHGKYACGAEIGLIHIETNSTVYQGWF